MVDFMMAGKLLFDLVHHALLLMGDGIRRWRIISAAMVTVPAWQLLLNLLFKPFFFLLLLLPPPAVPVILRLFTVSNHTHHN